MKLALDSTKFFFSSFLPDVKDGVGGHWCHWGSRLLYSVFPRQICHVRSPARKLDGMIILGKFFVSKAKPDMELV